MHICISEGCGLDFSNGIICFWINQRESALISGHRASAGCGVLGSDPTVIAKHDAGSDPAFDLLDAVEGPVAAEVIDTGDVGKEVINVHEEIFNVAIERPLVR